jgi:hypothetical protein
LRESATSSRVLPRQLVIPIPVTTTRLCSAIDRAERADLPDLIALLETSLAEVARPNGLLPTNEAGFEKDSAIDTERSSTRDRSIMVTDPKAQMVLRNNK